MKPCKNLLLAVSGGIAAYKSLELVRLCQKSNFKVRVLMTKAATQLVSANSFQALSHYPVATSLWNAESESVGEAKQHGMHHIELAKWADILLVAPATANTLSKMLHGSACDLLNNTLLATQATIAVAPAMNVEMWCNPATQRNIEQLQQRNIHIWGPASGDQACGDTGAGRMLEPEQLLQRLVQLGHSKYCFDSLLITAGASQEAIDPVRFIGNTSSGRMGVELARAACLAGIKTTFIHAAVNEQLLNSLPKPVTKISALSAQAMLKACLDHYQSYQVMIGAAAIADYRPQTVATKKIKKTAEPLTLTLQPNPDIIKTIASQAKPPFMTGFALETDNLIKNAAFKLKEKKLNLIFANEVTAINATESKLIALWQTNNQLHQQASPKQDKFQQAQWILERINQQFSSQ